METEEVQELIGELSGGSSITGYLSMPEKIGTPYKGDYEAVPSAGFQFLPTMDKHLEDNIIIHPIPYAEVSNLSGGYTASIG